MIRNAQSSDAGQIAEIYNYYILHTASNFELESISSEQMLSRINEVQQNLPWLVFEENKRIIGYAYATKWKLRAGYRKTVEISVYIDKDYCGKGIGSLLYSNLLELLKEIGIHSAIGGIALPNEKSVRLHEKLGFEKVAHFREVGFKFDRWIDVGYWQIFFST